MKVAMTSWLLPTRTVSKPSRSQAQLQASKAEVELEVAVEPKARITLHLEGLRIFSCRKAT